MVYSIINCKDSSMADALLLSARYDRTASGRKGARNGPGRIVDCLHTSLEFYDREFGDEPAFMYKVAHQDLGPLQHLHPEKMVAKIGAGYAEHYAKRPFIVLLGGEHSVTVGALSALAREEDPTKVTILHIDAHFDLRDSDADYIEIAPSNYAHSCVMRRCHELGFPIVTVGVRTGSREEYDYARKNITFFEWGQGSIPDIDAIVRSIRTEKVYISLDVDGIDPGAMPATGTPVQGGLSWEYSISLLRSVFKEKEVIAADIVEVAPTEDDILTEYGAAQLCYHMVSWKLHRAVKA